jgi:rubrerythrin
MGLIDDAVALERRAEAAYRTASATTSDAGAKKILDMLADAEAKHAAALREMKGTEDLVGPNLVDEAKRWIHGAVEGGRSTLSADSGLLDLLRSAMEMERETEAFYRAHQDESSEPRVADLFAALAGIERSHFHFVSSLVEYYNRPNEWVESAEFGTRPTY